MGEHSGEASKSVSEIVPPEPSSLRESSTFDATTSEDALPGRGGSWGVSPPLTALLPEAGETPSGSMTPAGSAVAVGESSFSTLFRPDSSH